MIQKTLTINKCDDCPFFDNSYYSYARVCTKLERVLDDRSNDWTKDDGDDQPIPTDCPLPDDTDQADRFRTPLETA